MSEPVRDRILRVLDLTGGLAHWSRDERELLADRIVEALRPSELDRLVAVLADKALNT